MNGTASHPAARLASLLEENGMSPTELARRSGVPQPTIWRILNKESLDPANATLEKLARTLKVTVAQLRGEAPLGVAEPSATYANTSPAPDVHSVPLVSWVQAGRLQTVEDPYAPGQSEGWQYTTKRVGPRAYALRVRGNSMENPNGKPTFPDGCIIIVDPDKPADLGSFVVVRLDDTLEATFKQLVEDAGVRYLRPLNPQYPMIQINGNATLCGTWVQTIIDSD